MRPRPAIGNADGDLSSAGDRLQIDDTFDDPGGGVTWNQITPGYDANGNLTDDGIYLFTYDAWNRLVRATRRVDPLTHADRQALAVYCDTWSRWREASDFVRKHGAFLPVKDDSGKLKYLHQFPQVSIAQKLLTNLLRYQQEFGLTPSSRSGIESTGAREPDALDLFLAEHSSGLSPTWSGPSRDNAADAAADRLESID